MRGSMGVLKIAVMYQPPPILFLIRNPPLPIHTHICFIFI